MDFANDIGESAALQISSTKLINYLGLDSDLSDTVGDIVNQLVTGKEWNSKD